MIYGFLFFAMLTHWHEKSFIPYYVVLCMMFFDCKNSNVRSLMLIVIIGGCVFYQVDSLSYYLTAIVFPLGKVVGDIVMNFTIICSYIAIMLLIFHRESVSRFICRKFNFDDINYVPTRADLMQIYMIKIMLIYSLIYTGYMIFLALEYFELKRTSDEKVLIDFAYEKYSKVSNYYVRVLSFIGSLKLVLLFLYTLPWTHKRVAKL